MNWHRTRELIYSDYRRHRRLRVGGPMASLSIILMTQGLWATSVYRLGHCLETARIPLLRNPLRRCLLLVQKIVEIMTGVSLPVECEVGKGLYIGHFGPIIINPRARLGDNCNLS